MTKNIIEEEILRCPNCGNQVFGLWKHGRTHPCSKKCLRILIEKGEISIIPPYVAFPELGLLPSSRTK